MELSRKGWPGVVKREGGRRGEGAVFRPSAAGHARSVVGTACEPPKCGKAWKNRRPGREIVLDTSAQLCAADPTTRSSMKSKIPN